MIRDILLDRVRDVVVNLATVAEVLLNFCRITCVFVFTVFGDGFYRLLDRVAIVVESILVFGYAL